MAVVINEVCKGETSSKPKNTGGKKQCLEGAVKTYILAKDTFRFADLAEAKSKTSWDLAKKNKDIVVFYDIEELEPNNTEAKIKNGRFGDYKISEAKKGVNYTHYLGSCSHEVVKSYENSSYTRIFRVTEKNELLCEVQDDGSIKGEPLKSFIVGIRDDAPADGTPSTKVQLKFDNYSLSIINPNFDLTSYEGIYDVKLSLVSTSSTSIKFSVTTSCGNDLIKSFSEKDFGLVSGVTPVNLKFVPANAVGTYEFVGSDLKGGYTLRLMGVIIQAEASYEAEAPLSISIPEQPKTTPEQPKVTPEDPKIAPEQPKAK